MERLSGGAVSTMFTSDVDARSDNEESIHDATLEFSFDLSGDLDLTSILLLNQPALKMT